jgi:uncharacterized membrane protein YpjA
MTFALAPYLAGPRAADRIVNFLSAFRELKVFAFVVGATNIGGVAYGVYYYWDQLLATPAYLLPFVPDSPSGPFLMVIVYALWWFGGHKRSPLLELFAFVWLLKYGIWTLLAFGLYADYFFTPERAQLSTTLFWFHFGEAIEAGVLLKGMKFPSAARAAFAAVWILLGDFSDYVLGTHPRLPTELKAFEWVPLITVALSFICYLAALGWCRRLARKQAGDAIRAGERRQHDQDWPTTPRPP